jgi:hypothetical protein
MWTKRIKDIIAMLLIGDEALTLIGARQAVVNTQAGRQLRDLAQGEHRHQKAKQWQASLFWERAEQRFMH